MITQQDLVGVLRGMPFPLVELAYRRSCEYLADTPNIDPVQWFRDRGINSFVWADTPEGWMFWHNVDIGDYETAMKDFKSNCGTLNYKLWE
jgi:hypothetical protein